MLAYNKTLPEHIRMDYLPYSIAIHDYEPERDASNMEVVQKIIEQHKGVQLNGLSEELQQKAQVASITHGLNAPPPSFIEINGTTVYFVTYAGGRQDLNIVIHY